MSTTPSTSVTAAPVTQSERIVILDALRGIAILGILLMNIPGFALPSPAYGDPTLMNEISTINFKTWYFVEWFLEGSQRALFSMLFGAGMVLFISRLENKTDGLWPADYFFRRQLWLLVFGLFNAFVLLWFWDVLFHYACCGMILFAFRRLPVKKLLIAAAVCLVLQTARDNVDFYRDKKVITRGEMIAKMDTTQTKLTDIQKDQLQAMTGFKEKTSPEGKKKSMQKSLDKVRGDYAGFYEYQSERSYNSEVKYLYFGLWDILIFMFLGMAFYKSGILTGQAPVKTYWFLFIAGLGGGLILSWLRLKPLIDYNFNFFEFTKKVFTIWSTVVSKPPVRVGLRK